MVINYLEQTFQLVYDTRIAFIYFNHKENPSGVDLLGNLLKQILQQQTDISPPIRDLYNRHTISSFHHRHISAPSLGSQETF
jgi:hypothetical protein